ncbi:MAG: hypothetical protein L3K07_05255 [Thermoplasmata archaeon]|nr:hypothetical protein [Thermoplasmata archaeon]
MGAGSEPASVPRWKPLLALAALSPFLAEYLSGSTPIALLLNPIAFLVSAAFLAGLYGAGVLLVRELTVRWHRGWESVLLLGTAYGILEEGVGVHTFFATGGSTVGVFATYGHYLGTNWVWAVGLAGFHGMYSIALPILVVGLWYPQWRERPLLEGRRLPAVAGIFAVTVLLLSLFYPYAPSALGFVGCFLVAGLLGLLAWKLPRDLLLAPAGARGPGRATLLLLGAAYLPAWLLVGSLGAAARLPVTVTIVLVLLFCELPVLLGFRYVGRLDDPEPAFLFASGAILTLAAWAVLLELVGKGLGIVAVAVVALLLLRHVRSKIRARASPEGTAHAAAVPPASPLAS